MRLVRLPTLRLLAGRAMKPRVRLYDLLAAYGRVHDRWNKRQAAMYERERIISSMEDTNEALSPAPPE